MNDAPPQVEKKSWFNHILHWFHRKVENRKDLIQVLREAQKHELLEHEAFLMIEGVLKVSEMQVRDVMIPRAQMVVVEQNDTPQQALPIIIESAHSRFPIIRENRDEVLGILLAKDLLRYILFENQTQITIKDLQRPVIFIPESKRLNVLLREFRLNRNHMAMVVDEYGGISGLITIEDVLEQIVGDIEDEYDIKEEEPDIKAIAQDEYVVKALTPIPVFNAYFNVNISDEDFDTIGGYVLQIFGHMPKRGESIMIDSLKITVALSSKRQVQLLKVSKLPAETS